MSLILQHPSYNNGACTFCNDVAVIGVTNMNLGTNAGAIELPRGGDDFANDECVLSGWGRTGKI